MMTASETIPNDIIRNIVAADIPSEVVEQSHAEFVIGRRLASWTSPIEMGLDVLHEYTAPRHIIAIWDAIRRHPRIAVTVPFRTGKSLLIARLLPAWLMVRGGVSVVIATHTAELAMDHVRAVRQLLGEIGVELKMSAQHRIETVTDGRLVGVGVGGPLTGRGADWLIIDDPVKTAAEVESELQRRRLHDWLRNVALSRLSPDGRAIVVMTRWHHDDLIGRLEDDPTWHVLRIPAQADSEDDPLGRQIGEWLELPWVTDLEEYWEVRRIDAGPRVWATAYQCRPSVETGEFFERRWLEREVSIEEVDLSRARIVTGVDIAVATEHGADRSAIATVAHLAGGEVVVLEVRTGRWGWSGTVDRVIEQWNRWGGSVVVEAVGVQVGMVQVLRQRGVRVEPAPARGPKTVRAARLQAIAGSGRLVFSPGPWVADVIAEMLAFPRGSHDDIVDALAYAADARPRARVVM